MITAEKSPQQTEWVPIVFILSATYICTVVLLIKSSSDVAIQGALNIALTFAGAAGGAYAPRLMSRWSQTKEPPAETPNP